jgi:hypothetical protein
MELLGHNGSYHANPNVIVANCSASHYTIINTFASSLFLLIKSKYWISSVRAWLAACGCNLKLPATRFATAAMEINKTNGRCFFLFCESTLGHESLFLFDALSSLSFAFCLSCAISEIHQLMIPVMTSNLNTTSGWVERKFFLPF